MSDPVSNNDVTHPSAQIDFFSFVAKHPAVLVYFTGPDCNVCKILKPRVAEMIKADFPRVLMKEIDCQKDAPLAAALGVLSIPTIVLYFDGREGARFVRHFGINELRQTLKRPYELLFD